MRGEQRVILLIMSWIPRRVSSLRRDKKNYLYIYIWTARSQQITGDELERRTTTRLKLLSMRIRRYHSGALNRLRCRDTRLRATKWGGHLESRKKKRSDRRRHGVPLSRHAVARHTRLTLNACCGPLNFMAERSRRAVASGAAASAQFDGVLCPRWHEPATARPCVVAISAS